MSNGDKVGNVAFCYTLMVLGAAIMAGAITGHPRAFLGVIGAGLLLGGAVALAGVVSYLVVSERDTNRERRR